MKQGLFLIAASLAVAGCNQAAKKGVLDQLIDPDSAQFSEVDSKDSVTCGLVNSKNRVGGYVGPRAFIFESGTARVEGDEDRAILSELMIKCPDNIAQTYAMRRLAEMTSKMRAENDHVGY